MIVLSDAENSTVVSSFVWTKHRNVTDERTDGRTELVWLLQRSALRSYNWNLEVTVFINWN